MATAVKAQKGSGRRRKFKGKMVQPGGSPRSHTHGGHSPARHGWSVGDAGPNGPKGKLQTSKHLPGKFRIGPPTKREHRRGFFRSISA